MQADPIRREVQKVLPRLAAIAKEDPSNIEVHLGLSILYNRYGAFPQEWSRGEEQWREILKIDPAHRPAWALLTTRDILTRGGRYKERLKDLEGMIASAEKRGQKYIQIDGRVSIHRRWRPSDIGGNVTIGEVPSPQTPSPLYEYFADDSGRDVILTDFDATCRFQCSAPGGVPRPAAAGDRGRICTPRKRPHQSIAERAHPSSGPRVRGARGRETCGGTIHCGSPDG